MFVKCLTIDATPNQSYTDINLP